MFFIIALTKKTILNNAEKCSQISDFNAMHWG